MKNSRVWIVVALLGLLACAKNVQNNDAVRQGVIEHLSKNTGLNLASMEIEVQSVTFRDNEADATVSFKPKDQPGDQGMSMRYTLERKGNEWVVKAKADSGGGHGGMPPAAGEGMGMPPAAGGGMGMPPNHPPMAPGGGAGQQK